MHSRAVTSNPFRQPEKQWQVSLRTQRDHVAALEEAFNDLALSVSSFEVSEATGEWRMDIVTDVPPEEANIPARLTLISSLEGFTAPHCEIKPLESRDWISEVERNFPPLIVSRFYVYGSHVTEPPPLGKIALQVNAGAAFGSGEHATTSGCLKALDILSRYRRFMYPLDMGSGSGILALAMAKLWHVPVLGVDVDPVSVRVANENARANRVHGLVRFVAGDGYGAAEVREHAQFDLIVANILARPLMRMAPSLARNLAPGGIAVLSGLLASQERMVLAAHRAQGLRLWFRISQGGWNTLVLRRR